VWHYYPSAVLGDYDMKTIKAFSFRYSLLFSLFILALTMIITEIPLNNVFIKLFDSQTAYYLSVTLEQAVCAAIVAIYIAHAGILRHAGLTKPLNLKELWLVWPILVLTIINGWPLFDGSMAVDTSRPLVLLLFILIALSTGFYEEILCRGLILSVCLRKWGKNKRGVYLAVMTSSVIFGFFHLVNYFLGRGSLLQVMTQIVYSTFFGVFFSACFLRFGSIWPAIITHSLFDMMGTLDEIAAGNKFISHILNANYSLENALSAILITAPLFMYGLFILRKVKPESQPEDSYFLPQ